MKGLRRTNGESRDNVSRPARWSVAANPRARGDVEESLREFDSEGADASGEFDQQVDHGVPPIVLSSPGAVPKPDGSLRESEPAVAHVAQLLTPPQPAPLHQSLRPFVWPVAPRNDLAQRISIVILALIAGVMLAALWYAARPSALNDAASTVGTPVVLTPDTSRADASGNEAAGGDATRPDTRGPQSHSTAVRALASAASGEGNAHATSQQRGARETGVADATVMENQRAAHSSRADSQTVQIAVDGIDAESVSARVSGDDSAKANAARAAGGDGADTAAAAERIVAAPTRAPLVTIPEGTLVPLSLDTAIHTTSAVGAPVRARVARHVMVRNRVVIPRGSVLTGSIVSVPKPRSRVASGLKFWELGRQPGVEVRFTSLRQPGPTATTQRIRTAVIAAGATKPNRKVAIPAAMATVGGAVLGGPLGAAGGGIIVSAIGGSVKTNVRVPKGTQLTTRFVRAATLQTVEAPTRR